MTTEQDQSTTEDRPDKATSSTTDRPIASGDGRSASFAVSGPDSPGQPTTATIPGPYIDDIAPRRTRDFGDLSRAGLSLLMAAVVMVFAVYLGGMTRGVESDAHTAPQAINWLAAFPSTVLTQLATTVIVVIRARSVALGPRGCKLRCPRWPCLPDTALCGSYRRQSAV